MNKAIQKMYDDIAAKESVTDEKLSDLAKKHKSLKNNVNTFIDEMADKNRNEFMITPVHQLQPAELARHNEDLIVRQNPLGGTLRSPLHSTDDGTEQSMSPYVMMKNRLMLTSSH